MPDIKIPNSKQVSNPQKGNTDYDSIPSLLYYIKAAQEGNTDGANLAFKHVLDVHGEPTATSLSFLGHQMKYANINDLARRNVGMESDPNMKRLYAMINENPDILNKFEFSLPQKKDPLTYMATTGLIGQPKP